MFSLVTRIVRQLLAWPVVVLGFAALLTCFTAWPISSMRWSLALTDLLPEDIPSRRVAKQIEEIFGGFGTLTVIVSSPDSSANLSVIRKLSDALENHPLVHFTEYRTEAEFYRKQQFLYIRLQDLQAIRDRIRARLSQLNILRNPLIVELEPAVQDSSPIRLDDLKDKYDGYLRDYLGNPEKTILVLEIYPDYPLNNLDRNRALVRLVRRILHQIPLTPHTQIHFAGKVYEHATTGGMLLREIYRIGWITAGIILVFMVFWFIRIPQIPLIAAMPLGMALIWTLGLNAAIYGQMNLFTLLLGLVIPGLGTGQIIHLLSRYAEERRRGLGITLALESAILGIGPLITLTSLACALAFYALNLLPLSGLRQLGIIGGTGILLTWFAILLVFPAMLIVLQKRKPFRVYGPRVASKATLQDHPSGLWKKLLPVALGMTLLFGIRGFFPHFDYDFSRVEYESPTKPGKEKLKACGLPTQEPAVALTRNAREADRLAETILEARNRDPSPTVDKVLTYTSLLPRQQKEKIALIAEIRSLLTPEILASLRGQDSANAYHILNHTEVQELTTVDLPVSYQRKFLGKGARTGQFSFIYPSVNTDDGRACRQFAADIRETRLDDSTVVYATGLAIMRADILDLTLPHLHQVFYAITAGIFLLVLIHQNRFYRTLFILVPPAVGFLWCLSLLRLFNLPLNPYNALVFPMLVGLSITGSMHLWHAYREESTGSIPHILRTTGRAVAGSSLSMSIWFAGLLFSAHPGLRSMGMTATLGLFSITLAQFIWFPLLVGWLDNRRFRKQKDS